MVRVEESPKYRELRLERPNLSQASAIDPDTDETDRDTDDELTRALLALLATSGSITYEQLVRLYLGSSSAWFLSGGYSG